MCIHSMEEITEDGDDVGEAGPAVGAEAAALVCEASERVVADGVWGHAEAACIPACKALVHEARMRIRSTLLCAPRQWRHSAPRREQQQHDAQAVHVVLLRRAPHRRHEPRRAQMPCTVSASVSMEGDGTAAGVAAAVVELNKGRTQASVRAAVGREVLECLCGAEGDGRTLASGQGRSTREPCRERVCAHERCPHDCRTPVWQHCVAHTARQACVRVRLCC